MNNFRRTKAAFPSALLVLMITALIGGSNAAGLTNAAPTTRLTFATELLVSGFTTGPHRQLTVSHISASAGKAQGHVNLAAQIDIKNLSATKFNVSRGEFYLSALGDALGHVSVATGGAAGASVNPGAHTSGALTFDIPADAVPYVSLVDQPPTGEAPLIVPLGKNAAPGATVVGASFLSSAATNGNTIEDDFTRANQSGWGASTNADGVAPITWGMDGTASWVNISNNTGVYGYQGTTNQIGIASAGSLTYNGGDSLVAFSLSAVGHVTPYTVQNACANKSCYYGARLHTSQNTLELARRSGGGTGILASIPFTASANTLYWLRLDVVPNGATSTLVQAKIWANGAPEPTNWLVSATDSAPLASNLVGTGGTWDLSGTGERINYTCYAFATSGLASPCGGSGGAPTPTPTAATPTPTATTTTTPTPTPTNSPTTMPAPTITRTWLNPGVGEPWGTAIDSKGNIWFAEAGCDFAPTCSPSATIGQIGELSAGSGSPIFWKLPNITGNQPIFVALDGSGNVWFTTPNNSMIGEFSPATQQFVGQWPVTPNTGPWDLTFNNGKIWYTEHLVSAIGEFDPVTHTYQDFQTPTANSFPYGIVGSDPVNSNLVWFTENSDTVGKIGVINTTNNKITEYSIRAQPLSGLTPHLIALDANGNPWWTEGWVRAVGVINLAAASASKCGVSSGDCIGVTEYGLGSNTSTCGGSHISGISLQSGSSVVWATDSLANQVDTILPSTGAVALNNLSSCGAHPHDGLNHDPSGAFWWDEEFDNALGEAMP